LDKGKAKDGVLRFKRRERKEKGSWEPFLSPERRVVERRHILTTVGVGPKCSRVHELGEREGRLRWEDCTVNGKKRGTARIQGWPFLTVVIQLDLAEKLKSELQECALTRKGVFVEKKVVDLVKE